MADVQNCREFSSKLLLKYMLLALLRGHFIGICETFSLDMQ